MKKFRMLSRRLNEQVLEETFIRAKNHREAIFILMRDKYRTIVSQQHPYDMLKDVHENHGVFVFSPDESDREGNLHPVGMRITMGSDGLKRSYQGPFKEEEPCPKCGGVARFAFVADEMPRDREPPRGPLRLLCNHYPDDPEGSGAWPHGACSVAVYFCKKCLEPVAKLSQA